MEPDANSSRAAASAAASVPKRHCSIGVVGSRNFTDYSLLCSVLDPYLATEIVSGGAAGADTLGHQYAIDHKIPANILLPDWKAWRREHGGCGVNRAGFERNGDIIAACDIIVAFWDGKSNGTRETIAKAKKVNKLSQVILFDASKQHPKAAAAAAAAAAASPTSSATSLFW